MKGRLEFLLNGFLQGMGIALGLGTTALIAVSVTGSMHSFAGAQVVSASQLNTNFNSLRAAIESTREPPVGTILAWHKDLGSIPALPVGWLECNGQTVTDPASTLNGVTLPDLNGQGRFLRGAATSGTPQVSQFPLHTHRNNIIVRPEHIGNIYSDFGTGETVLGFVFGAIDGFNNTSSNPVRNPNVGFAGSGSETRPINMSVVWIIRVR